MVQVNPKLKLFIKKIKANMPDAKVLLFGSRVRGTAKKDSDYDIIIISPKFKNVNFIERSIDMYRLKDISGLPMDIMCLTPQEFNVKKKGINIIAEAAREGVMIA